jgi:hypothetical protein
LFTYICTRRVKKKKERRERNRLKGHMILCVSTDHNNVEWISLSLEIAPFIFELKKFFFIEKNLIQRNILLIEY